MLSRDNQGEVVGEINNSFTDNGDRVVTNTMYYRGKLRRVRCSLAPIFLSPTVPVSAAAPAEAPPMIRIHKLFKEQIIKEV